MDGSRNVSDIFTKQFFDATEAIRSLKKRPDCTSIHNYITRHNATNLDEKTVQETFELLVDKTQRNNTRRADSNFYYIIPQDQENIAILGKKWEESQLEK